MIHCTAGKDKTGLTMALLLSLAGVDNETIAWDYALSSEYLGQSYFNEAKERAALATSLGSVIDSTSWLHRTTCSVRSTT